MVNSICCAANRTLAEELSRQFTAIPPLNSRAMIIIDPLLAANLKDNEGFYTKMDYCRYLSKNIKMSAGNYWKADHINMLVTPAAYDGVEPFATWKSLPDDEMITPLYNPEEINLIVVGGGTSPLWKVTEYGFSGSALIDAWR